MRVTNVSRTLIGAGTVSEFGHNTVDREEDENTHMEKHDPREDDRQPPILRLDVSAYPMHGCVWVRRVDVNLYVFKVAREVHHVENQAKSRCPRTMVRTSIRT